MASTRLEHQPSLDGLRGVAVLAVIAFHLWPDAVPGGFLGVDTFFVVSGYLITSLLLAEVERTGAVDLLAFWGRRARRLLPALFVVLSVVAVAAAVWWPAEDLARIRGDALAGLGYVANWRAVAGGESYFDTVLGPSPLKHLWSLAIEEQFYALWPLVVVVACRAKRPVRAVGAVAAVGIALSVAVAVLLRADPTRAYYGTDTRAHTLLLGALLACCVPIGGRRRSPGARAGTLALLAGGASWFLVDETTTALFTLVLPLHAALTAIVIAGAVSGDAPRALVHPWLVAVGRVSYGLYLWHWPAIVSLTPTRTGFDGIGLLALRAGVTVVATLVSYRLVEQPFRHGRWRTSPRRRKLVLAPAAFATVALVVVAAGSGAQPAPAYLTLAGAGPLWSPPPSLAATPDGSVPATAAAAVAPRPTAPSTVPAADVARSAPAPSPAVAPTRVLLVGDSIAFTLQDALAAALADRGIAFAAATAVGCGAAAGVDPGLAITANSSGEPTPWAATCADAVPELQAQGLATGPDLVVLHSSWETSDRIVDGRHVAFGTADWDDLVRAELRAAIDRLSAGGATVALLTLPPIVDGALRPAPADDNRRLARLDQLLREVAAADPQRVTLVDLAGVVCGATPPCPVTVGGVILRPLDGAHFEPEGAAAVAPRLAELLVAVDVAGPGG